MDEKHCNGCRNDFYNRGGRSGGTGKCWSLKNAKLVWRIPVGHWETPPYKDKKKVKVPSCWHGHGGGTIYVKPETLTNSGEWKS